MELGWALSYLFVNQETPQVLMRKDSAIEVVLDVYHSRAFALSVNVLL
jgi:hypothetical protein